jgi:hypothetical protein
MLAVYLNYPNPTISAHPGMASAELKKHHKADQWLICINTATLSEELLRFSSKGYKFAADSTSNDMWLEIDFNDSVFELAVLAHVQRLLGKHYAPFAGVQIRKNA